MNLIILVIFILGFAFLIRRQNNIRDGLYRYINFKLNDLDTRLKMQENASINSYRLLRDRQTDLFEAIKYKQDKEDLG